MVLFSGLAGSYCNAAELELGASLLGDPYPSLAGVGLIFLPTHWSRLQLSAGYLGLSFGAKVSLPRDVGGSALLSPLAGLSLSLTRMGGATAITPYFTLGALLDPHVAGHFGLEAGTHCAFTLFSGNYGACAMYIQVLFNTPFGHKPSAATKEMGKDQLPSP